MKRATKLIIANIVMALPALLAIVNAASVQLVRIYLVLFGR